MTAPVTSAASLKCARCPRCGRAFDCGRNTEPFDCWCRTLPALAANQLDPRGRCLCPECLADAAAASAAAPGDGVGSGPRAT
ncbi:cysteine-rich CWC family protein [Paraburkholderia sp.]|uniref:cysteine-rich CWC family protein n=1 Tax=Paraburkholderia sp. TaxID=1926495 RepID=UPI0025E9584B|nr:cysteine-rich CWC family protein [Paraburkholderia sp.]